MYAMLGIEYERPSSRLYSELQSEQPGAARTLGLWLVVTEVSLSLSQAP